MPLKQEATLIINDISIDWQEMPRAPKKLCQRCHMPTRGVAGMTSPNGSFNSRPYHFNCAIKTCIDEATEYTAKFEVGMPDSSDVLKVLGGAA